jgi:hypothetical protein
VGQLPAGSRPARLVSCAVGQAAALRGFAGYVLATRFSSRSRHPSRVAASAGLASGLACCHYSSRRSCHTARPLTRQPAAGDSAAMGSDSRQPRCPAPQTHTWPVPIPAPCTEAVTGCVCPDRTLADQSELPAGLHGMHRSWPSAGRCRPLNTES